MFRQRAVMILITVSFLKEYKKVNLGARLICFLVRETPTENEIRDKVFSSDIIYVEGGSLSKLMDYFKKFKLDEILKEAHENEIILAGKSAGALCWWRYYFENNNTENFQVDGFNDYIEVECLELLDLIICPHYNLQGYSEKLEVMVEAYDLLGIGLDNNCAIEFIGDRYRIISSSDDANAYRAYKKGTKIYKDVIIKDNNFRHIDELMKVF